MKIDDAYINCPVSGFIFRRSKPFDVYKIRENRLSDLKLQLPLADLKAKDWSFVLSEFEVESEFEAESESVVEMFRRIN